MHGAHQPKDDPGLAAKLSGEPASRIRDVWEWRGEHQYPQHPASLEKPTPPEQEQGQTHNGDEDRAQANHDVITVIEHFDGIGMLVGRKGIETSNDRCPA